MVSEPKHQQIRQTLRHYFRKRRKELSDAEQVQAAKLLVKQCQCLKLLKDAQRIAIYLTNDGELDTQALIEYLWSKNIEVYLPVLHPFSAGHLLFLRYTQTTRMKVNAFGIPEPALDVTQIMPLKNLDLIFTPLVAFDNTGNRLGMGGGFYDRTLHALIKSTDLVSTNTSVSSDVNNHIPNYDISSPNPRVIGLAHDIQKSENLPTEAWDIPLPHILTPNKFYTFT